MGSRTTIGCPSSPRLCPAKIPCDANWGAIGRTTSSSWSATVSTASAKRPPDGVVTMTTNNGGATPILSNEARTKAGCAISRTTATLPPPRSSRRAAPSRSGTTSSIAPRGIAKRWPPATTISALTMLNVNGALSVIVSPVPGRFARTTFPPKRSTLARTTSMPTPRPETLVTSFAVESPGSNISAVASATSSEAARAGSMILAATAFSIKRDVSTPRPSSEISMLT